MKKFMMIIMVMVLIIAMSTTAFAAPARHPAVPEQSLQKISPNAANGMHTAWFNVVEAEGVASHVFLMRFSPH